MFTTHNLLYEDSTVLQGHWFPIKTHKSMDIKPALVSTGVVMEQSKMILS